MRLATLAAMALGLCVVEVATRGSSAHAQDCPLGKTCFYLPPIQPAPPISPNGYTETVILSAPTAAASYTLQYSAGTPAASSGSVSVGAATELSAYPGNMVSGFNTAEQRGVMITSSVPDLIVEQRTPATYWQSSSTIRPHTAALGTRFRVAGYNLNNANGTDNTGYDFLSFYAPQAATVTAQAPASGPASFWSGVSGKTVTVTLAAGQTYMIRTVSGVDIDATLVTSTAPISVVVGGRGWGCSAGDEGADQAMPTALFGQDFVVAKYPAPSLQDVRVLADSDNTHVSVNGSQVATLNAGGVYQLSGPSMVSYIHADQPIGVAPRARTPRVRRDSATPPP